MCLMYCSTLQVYIVTISGPSGPLPGLERFPVPIWETAEYLYKKAMAATGERAFELWWRGELLLRDAPLVSYGSCIEDWGTVTMLVVEPSDDRACLAALYHSCGGPGWTRSDNWMIDDKPLSSWHGVEVDSEGRVTVLELQNNSLVGALVWCR